MARRAGAIVKSEGKNLVGSSTQTDLMAIGTGHGGVRSQQREAGTAMLCNGVTRPVPVGHRVAIFTTIVVGSRGKLVVVCILVAVRAGGKLHLVNRILARCDVTLRAFHLNVLTP